ncbi:NfeD family protein [Siccirubricoccus sp. G192]|uniref:NfeD family protein n=1 Tax=Siccirubricoccus sp. G192 TaxID=2849651 RepID=UPI0020C1CC36|nr:NfeD family protein [Siccirubricoccus sp. G192]
MPGVFLLWVGLAAIGTGLTILLAAPGFAVVVVVFLLLLGAGIWTALRLRGRHRPTPRVNTPRSGLVGRSGTLLPAPGPGLRVRIGDSEWPARLPRDIRVPEGPIAVRVEAVDGTTLVVRPE